MPRATERPMPRGPSSKTASGGRVAGEPKARNGGARGRRGGGAAARRRSSGGGGGGGGGDRSRGGGGGGDGGARGRRARVVWTQRRDGFLHATGQEQRAPLFEVVAQSIQAHHAVLVVRGVSGPERRAGVSVQNLCYSQWIIDGFERHGSLCLTLLLQKCKS